MDVRSAIGDVDYVLNEPKRGKKPRISIITPTYQRNAEGLLRDCLQSALDQTFTDFEHIIIDDGSVDGTEQTVGEFAKKDKRIVYVRHDHNSGLPAVRTNEGIMRARGEAVAFLFDDNVLEPDFLKNALARLEKTQADLVHGEVAMPVNSGNDFVLGGWPASVDLMRSLNTVANGGILVRRDFFDRFGLYDPHVAARRLCDWELWCRSLWLGARFNHLPETVATEKGLISPNSLGNSVSVDWKSVYGYLQDTRSYRARAERFRPANILDELVLDAPAVHKYVRDEAEWKTVVDQVYTPFIERSGINFDPMLLSNRAASIDPQQGWNATWSIEQKRRRVLFVTNCVPSFVSMMMEAVRALPGTIVLNCPEWQFSAFEAGTFDTIYLIDCANPGIGPYLQQHREHGTSVVYASLYGNFESDALQQDLVPAYAKNPHVGQLFGGAIPYFPQPGIPHDENQKYAAAEIRKLADIIVGAEDSNSIIALPDFPAPSLARKPRKGEKIFHYRREDNKAGAGEATMHVTQGKTKRNTSSSLTAILTGNSDCEVRVGKEVLEALPYFEKLGLGSLATQNNISLRATGDRSKIVDDPLQRELAVKQWLDWLGSLERLTILRGQLKLPVNRPLVVDIFLMSELYSGSEAYGLILARNLHELGATVRVRVPEISVYGGDNIAVNGWLEDNDVPLAMRFPYAPGEAWALQGEDEQSGTISRLESALADDPADISISSGYIHMLLQAQRIAPMFMAVFSAAAYDQRQLLKLRGGVEGLMSDSDWALTPTQRVIRAPGTIIRSAVFGLGGSQTDRVVAAGKNARQTIRIAVTGTLQLRKRQLEAVRATRMLLDQGYDIELHLYGYELEMLREYLDTLSEEISRLDIASRVVRHGFVEDGSEITRDNHIILSASTDESLPQGLLFQMYEGLIGVAVLCGGIDEILEDKITGYLASDPTPEGVAAVLGRALDDRKNWKKIADNARCKVFEECNAPRMTGRLLELMIEGITLDARGVVEPVMRREITAEKVIATPGIASVVVEEPPHDPVEREPVPIHSKPFSTTLVLNTDMAGLSGVDISIPHALIHDAELTLKQRPGLPVCNINIRNEANGLARLRWPPMKGNGSRNFVLQLTASTYMPEHDRGIIGERNVYRAMRARKIQVERIDRKMP